MSDASRRRDGVDGAGSGGDQSADARVGTAEDVLATFELLPAATVCLRGPDHVVVAANAAYRAAMGKEEMIGLPISEAVPELAGQMAFEMVDRVWRTGRPEVQREWRIEVYDPVGAPSEIFVDFTGTPYAGASGEREGIIFEAHVVTERVRRREAEAREAQARRELVAAREVVTSLQLAMLPAGLPALPAVDLAAGYIVAEVDAAAGGDWFDAVPLGEGRVAVVVGDVVGHGVEASAVMGGLRAVLAAALMSTGDLTDALRQLDRYALTVPGAHAATVCVAVIDPGSTRVSYCTAGHPPPLLVSRRGATFAPGSGAAPLATGGHLPVAQLDLEPGSALVLYSDGLVERPEHHPAEAATDLAHVAGTAFRGETPGSAHARLAQRLCTMPLELLLRETGHVDDVTILAAHRLERSVPDVDVVLPATPAAIQDARLETAVLIGSNDLSHSSAMAFHHAVSELVANAVEHAYADRADRSHPGEVRLRACLTDDGTLRAVVSDHGRWRVREPEHRGLGLSLVEQLAHRLTIEHGDTGRRGTTVTVEVPARRDVHLSTAAGPPPPHLPGSGELSLSVHDGERGGSARATRVVVAGPVDLLGAERLRSALLGAAAGPYDIVLDLAEVTLLTSRAVQVIAELSATPVTGPRIWVNAPAGSPAAHVLDLVHLPVQRLPTP
ncbi:SpoIIE family protein phosphatase [Nocardioides zeicaulis]|uniref:SpoIIE family protein phosphatase n=1 Tax=Nocardioides zeicaulis TaxID=1776857 RepID=A0ABV6E380_9ACTN